EALIFNGHGLQVTWPVLSPSRPSESGFTAVTVRNTMKLCSNKKNHKLNKNNCR
ncbi:uncharacterized protein METZ01_LOCUS324470, partial [marine metagenome]